MLKSVLSSDCPPICSMRSMPVQNAFSPAPVSTTQRTSSLKRMRAPHVAQLALHERVERVVALGPVQRDPRDAVALLVRDRLEVVSQAISAVSAQPRWMRAMPGLIVLKTYLCSVGPISAGSHCVGLPSLSLEKNSSPISHGL